eukprot:TRINITY_DN7961_c0_g1_i1.p1 TRINITY_DN7961_c0_g1~~TRINITY_DN7961_c0_g1_i1.p1  ORF type:complete len:283 (+),score=65.34 TRINITY_DN7961_c0_g1_i1:5-853(+)
MLARVCSAARVSLRRFAHTAAPDAEDLVLIQRDVFPGVASITLNRPAARNALSSAMMTALQSAVDLIAADASIRMVVLEANGPVFCSGHDLKELKSCSSDEYYPVFRQCGDLMLSLQRMPQPVIAKVQGIATAAGAQLVASCDMAIAAKTAQFATPGVNIGLFCSTPMVAITRSVHHKAAMHMLLTGDMISAEKAERIGLITEAVDGDQLNAVVQKYAVNIASKAREVVALGKATFYQQVNETADNAYKRTTKVMATNMQMPDAKEGITAFFGKRPPIWANP